MTLLKLACLLVITWTCHASPQHGSDEGSGPCDYESVMKVVEKLERRVEALEAENAQQRSEIMELKAAMKEQQGDSRVASHEKEDANPANSDGCEASQQKNRIRRASPELTIAFYAALQTEVHHLGQGQNVVFENVVTNFGNAYDNHLGVFKAPVAGVYVFSTTVTTWEQDTTHYGFALNGQLITNFFANGADNKWDSDSQTIILQLKPGDDISVKHNNETDNGLYGNFQSVFSGFLLSMTDEGPFSIVG